MSLSVIEYQITLHLSAEITVVTEADFESGGETAIGLISQDIAGAAHCAI